MKRRFILYRRKLGGIFYVEDTETRKQESLGTKNRAEATLLLNARNESVRQPQLNTRYYDVNRAVRTCGGRDAINTILGPASVSREAHAIRWNGRPTRISHKI